MSFFNIILEGCDCVGKTSIYEEIMHRGILGNSMIGIKFFAIPPKSKYESKIMHEKILKVSNKFHGLVFDRHMLSEKVYAPILRKYVATYIDKLESQLKKHNLLFYITADIETIKKRFKKEKIISIDLIHTILSGYQFHFNRTKLLIPSYIIDTTNITPYQALQQIEKNILTHHYTPLPIF